MADIISAPITPLFNDFSAALAPAIAGFERGRERKAQAQAQQGQDDLTRRLIREIFPDPNDVPPGLVAEQPGGGPPEGITGITPGFNPNANTGVGAGVPNNADLEFEAAEAEGEKEISRLAELNPEVAKEVRAVLESGDPQQVENIQQEVAASTELANTISSKSGLTAKRKELTRIAEDIVSKGGDTSRIVELANMSEPELDLQLQKMKVIGKDVQSVTSRAIDARKNRAFAELAIMNPAAANVIRQQRQDLEDANNPDQGRANRFTKSPGVIVENEDGTFSQSIPVLNEGTGEIEQTLVPISGTPVTRLGQTAAEKAQTQVGVAGGSEAARQDAEIAAIPEKKAVENREQRHDRQIDESFTAAETLPVINRGLELLELVDTGGFDAAKLKASQILGIESADEAELNNSLGKAVLSQLKATFGAAFSAQEGQLLQDIEANFGKSTAGNKRLLERAQRSMKNRIRRGRRAAGARGDTETIDELDALGQETLTPDSDVSGQTDEDLLSSF